MDSIYIEQNCGEAEYKILINGKYQMLQPESGESLLGKLAPFTFNPVQQAFRAYYKGGNAVIATPTGTGKTVVSFIAMLDHENPERIVKPTIYLSPTRALARQVYQELKDTDLKVFLRTGEKKMDVKENFDIVVATPEAFLASRHSSAEWIKRAKLVIVDEAHMLVQDSRGIVYEESIVHALGDEKTLILLSATMPDALEMANWTKAELLIESNWRPLPLERKFVRYSAPTRKNRKKVATAIYNDFLEHNIQNHTKTMIIIPSKKSGWYLLEAFEEMGFPVLNETVPYIKRTDIANAIAAFHNADIPIDERHEIEKRFKDQNDPLTVLVSTQTLAYGFNSPTDDILIFVKYSAYNDDNLWPTFLDLLQFEGRAGRKGHTTRGYGQVLYSTGARAGKTQEILEEKLRKGLDDVLETALDKSFTRVSQGYLNNFSSGVTRELGDVELATLGIMSVEPVRIMDIHYKDRSKKKVLDRAHKRLVEIGMLDEEYAISSLGQLTASYMLNPEKVNQFASVIPKTNDGEPDDQAYSFWEKYNSTALLIPTYGSIPPHYPPFIPIFPGLWNVATITGNFPDTGILQYGLSTLTTRIGAGFKKDTPVAMRQRPPAWTASISNELQLVMSFIKRGAYKGFWPDMTDNEYQRIVRSLSYGVHPYYSLLTEITNIGSIRANMLAFVAMNAGIQSDVDLVYRILSDEKAILDVWPQTQQFLQSWYALQAKWIHDELEIEGNISISEIINTDYQTFQEAVYLVQKEAEEKGKTFYGVKTLDFIENPMQNVVTEFKAKYPEALLFIKPSDDQQKAKDMLYSDSITLVATDSNGNGLGKAKVYKPGRLPPKVILEYIPHAEPFLASDTRKFIWVD
ncbi:MAG TPA: DEAD/DEAH box helicase [Thermotogota bacterium]|nr:DEAD/DEAH box helicase [Thermotogota bacterium]